MLLTPLLLSVLTQAPSPADAELRERFRHGTELFDHGDATGAAAEFERVLRVKPSAGVKFNLAVVEAARGESVHAVELFEAAIASGDLKPDRVARAKELLAAEQAKLGAIRVNVSVNGAQVDVDGRSAGTSPLATPVRAKAGTRVVTVLAPDCAPLRIEVPVLAQQTAEISLTPEPLARKLAQLAVKSSTPGADVFIDGLRAGTTPLRATLAIVPGEHRIELRREGFLSQSTTLPLGEGASGEVRLDLSEDPEVLRRDGAHLTVRASGISEDEKVTVTVDGKQSGLYTGPLRLVPGPHVLVFESGGFYPVTQELNFTAGGAQSLLVELDPTPQLRAEVDASVRSHRRLGWLGVAGGGALFGGGLAYVIYNLIETQRLEGEVVRLTDDRNSSSGCKLACGQEVEDAQNRLSRGLGLRPIGYVAIGVGVAAIGAGVFAFLSAPDSSRFDRPEKPSQLIDGFSLGFTQKSLEFALSGRF